jgi:hypothetical protein
MGNRVKLTQSRSRRLFYTGEVKVATGTKNALTAKRTGSWSPEHGVDHMLGAGNRFPRILPRQQG